MKQLYQTAVVLSGLDEDTMLRDLGAILAVPYDKDTFNVDKAKMVVRNCVKRGHLSVLEHLNITMDCLTNIETYKDYTRHRHCAFTIESTSFVNYDEANVILCGMPTNEEREAIDNLHKFYSARPPKNGRDYLLQSQAARMIMTTNIREWRWIIGLRGDPNDNPLTNQLRDLMWVMLNEQYPFFFPLAAAIDDPMMIRNEWSPKKDMATMSAVHGVLQ